MSVFTEGAIILGYHRIAETHWDPHSLCVTPKHFTEHLEVLSRQVNPISLEELILALGSRTIPQRAVAVTMDDGYADNLHNGKRILERYQIPATIFITTDYIGREFWWDEVKRLLISNRKQSKRLSLEINGTKFNWTLDPLDSHQTKKKALFSLCDILRHLPPQKRDETITKLRDWANCEPQEKTECKVLTAKEIVELTKGGLLDIGSHSSTHPFLEELPLHSQRSEIQESKACLEEILGRPVKLFSYPNGSVSEATQTIVKDSGFICACASYNDVVRTGCNPFYLPRFWIPDCDGPAFSRWLHTWLHG
jgi:peptidoglycan/xylan/chitin deacetylase (PgdA/CDA1 family)